MRSISRMGPAPGPAAADPSTGSRYVDDLLRLDRPAFWLAQVAIWGTFGAITYLTFLGQLEPGQRLPAALLKLVIRPALGIAASTLLMLGYRRWLEGRRYPAPLVGAAVLGACTVLGFAWLLAGYALFRPFSPFPGSLDWTLVPRTVLEYVFALLAWSAGYAWIRSRRDAQARRRQALRAAAATRAAQLELLARQLDPHFLFNALTSLRGLIHQDPVRAELVVGRLAAFLRRTLTRPATAIAYLSDELEHVEAYLEIERTRHGPDLETAIRIESGAERARVPTFLLHPLVENAVKHARTRDGRPPRIELRATMAGERLRVEVENPGALTHDQSPARDGNGAGVGLANVRRRLAQYSPGRHSLRLLELNGRVRAVLEVDQSALHPVQPELDAPEPGRHA